MTEILKHPSLPLLVSSSGLVLRIDKANFKWTPGSQYGPGYRAITLGKKKYPVHRLVVETFIGHIPEDMEIDHIDRDPNNNRVGNLRIVTHRENMLNSWTHLHPKKERSRRLTAPTEKVCKSSTYVYVNFSDGTQGRFPKETAERLLSIPIGDRTPPDPPHPSATYAQKYRAEHRDYYRNKSAAYNETHREEHRKYQSEFRKSHRYLKMPDGKQHWVPNEIVPFLKSFKPADRTPDNIAKFLKYYKK